MDKKHKLTTENGFFNLLGWFSVIKYDWLIDIILLINCERNTGKSTASWEFIEKEIWEKNDFKWKILYCRSTLEQLDRARQDFNVRFNGKYYMTTSFIFRQFFDEKGKEILSKRQEIGAIASVSTQMNNKSMTFDGYHVIFWDEYNDIINRIGIYAEFVNLVKTAQRFTKPLVVLLIGNKDNANNEFMVKYGIEVDYDNKDDTVIEIERDKDGMIVFIDIGTDRYKHLNQWSGLANKMAKYDDEMDRYLNHGGYRVNQHIDVINFKLRIAETAKPKYYILTKKSRFEIGDFVHHKSGKSIYIRLMGENDNIDYSINSFALSELDTMSDSKSAIIDNDESHQIMDAIYRASRRQTLFYTSFDAKIIMEMWYTAVYRKSI